MDHLKFGLISKALVVVTLVDFNSEVRAVIVVQA